MQSPLGSHKGLERVELEPGLVAQRCPETLGHWISLENYQAWHATLPVGAGEPTHEKVSVQAEVSEFDDMPKQCPESGAIMMRYRVGHGLPFRIDRSRTGGVWLDAGEWEALQSCGLHHLIHRISTGPWQQAVRQQDMEATVQAQLEERLGEDLLQRLTALRAELAQHPQRDAALAFLKA
ncbi:MAG TPA: hypothetical protein VGE29_02800 [Prosthecobacter sp.]